MYKFFWFWSMTSKSIKKAHMCHICVFLTDFDVNDQNQNDIHIQGLFFKKRDKQKLKTRELTKTN
jgi:hypothetical protein